MTPMPTFKTLPRALVHRLLEGTQDELTPLAVKRNTMIKATPCPRCGTSLHARLAPLNALFTPDYPLPQLVGTCPECGFEVSAATGVVYSTGDGRKVTDPLPIVNPKKD